jgi:hypothetical protein
MEVDPRTEPGWVPISCKTGYFPVLHGVVLYYHKLPSGKWCSLEINIDEATECNCGVTVTINSHGEFKYIDFKHPSPPQLRLIQ